MTMFGLPVRTARSKRIRADPWDVIEHMFAALGNGDRLRVGYGQGPSTTGATPAAGCQADEGPAVLTAGGTARVRFIGLTAAVVARPGEGMPAPNPRRHRMTP